MCIRDSPLSWPRSSWIGLALSDGGEASLEEATPSPRAGDTGTEDDAPIGRSEADPGGARHAPHGDSAGCDVAAHGGPPPPPAAPAWSAAFPAL
eukprot:13275513-Alexandrium_andersonii.AAC.1